VKFSIYNIVPKKLVSQTLASLNSSFSDASKFFENNTFKDKPVDSNSKTASALAKKGLNYGTDLQSFVTPEIKKTSTEIYLYMPDTLAVDYVNSYQENDLETMTNGYNRIIGGLSSIAEQVINGGQSKTNIAINAADQFGVELAGKGIDKILGTNGGITDLALKASGKAINPQLQLIYRGVGFRTFNMTFIFTPKSERESDHVSAIINAFVFASSPTVDTAGAGMYFIPPSIFSMQFLMAASDGGIENDRIFKVGKCILETVNVDYAPNGWAAYSGGAPVQTQLTLQFKEIQILDRNRMRYGDVR
jgi:hypothetical protein